MPISSGANRWPKSYWKGKPVKPPPPIRLISVTEQLTSQMARYKRHSASVDAGRVSGGGGGYRRHYGRQQSLDSMTTPRSETGDDDDEKEEAGEGKMQDSAAGQVQHLAIEAPPRCWLQEIEDVEDIGGDGDDDDGVNVDKIEQDDGGSTEKNKKNTTQKRINIQLEPGVDTNNRARLCVRFQ